MKNSSDTIGNRTHDLPAGSEAPQPFEPPSVVTVTGYNYVFFCSASLVCFELLYFRHITALSIISAQFTKFYVEVSPVNLLVSSLPAADISFLVSSSSFL